MANDTFDWDEVLVTRYPRQKEVQVSFVAVDGEGSPGGDSVGNDCPPGTFKHYNHDLLENGGFEVLNRPNTRITTVDYPDFIDTDFFIYVSREEARPFDEYVDVSFEPRPTSPFPWTVDKLPAPVKVLIEKGQRNGKLEVKMPEGSKWSGNPELYPSNQVGLYYLFDMVINSPACDSRALTYESPCSGQVYVLPSVEIQGRRPFILSIDTCDDERGENPGVGDGAPVPPANTPAECAGHDCLAYENAFNGGEFDGGTLALTFAVTESNASINFSISSLEMSQIEPQSIGFDNKWYAYGKLLNGSPATGIWAGTAGLGAPSATSFPIRSGIPVSDPDEVITCTPRYVMMKLGLPAGQSDINAMVNRERNIDWDEDDTHYGWTLQDNDLGPAESGYRTAQTGVKYYHEQNHAASAVCMVVNRVNPEAPITQAVIPFIAATGIASFSGLSFDGNTSQWTDNGRIRLAFEVWGELDFASDQIVLYDNFTGEFARIDNNIQGGVPFAFTCRVDELSVTHYRTETNQLGTLASMIGSVSIAGAYASFSIDRDFGVISNSGASWSPSKLFHPKGGGSGDGAPVRLMLTRTSGSVPENNVSLYTLAFGAGDTAIANEIKVFQRIFKKYLPPTYCERIPE